MQPHCTSTLLGLAAAAILWLPAAALADDPKLSPPQKDTLQAVLDRIKLHAAGEVWKQPGFKDEAIESWLDKLLESIAVAAEIRDLKLPVRLKDVRDVNVIPPDRTGALRGCLTVGKDLKPTQSRLVNSIVLADGNVVLSHIDNCVVIARGTITIEGGSNNCIFVSGIGFKGGELDGSSRGQPGSVIVSRGWAELSPFSHGTIVAAHEGIAVDNRNFGANNVTFINAPVPQRPGPFAALARRDNGSRSVRVPDLPLEAIPVHPLAGKFKVLGILHSVVKERPGGLRPISETTALPTAAVLQYEGRRYIADLDQPIVDESGAAAPGLSECRLTAFGPAHAVLSKPDADIVLRLEGK